MGGSGPRPGPPGRFPAYYPPTRPRRQGRKWRQHRPHALPLRAAGTPACRTPRPHTRPGAAWRTRFSGVGQARTERRPAAFHVAPEPAGTGGEIGPGFCTEFRSRLGGRSRSESWRVLTLLTGLQCVYFLVAYANSLSLATCLLNLRKTTAWPRRVCARRPEGAGLTQSPTSVTSSLHHRGALRPPRCSEPRVCRVSQAAARRAAAA